MARVNRAIELLEQGQPIYYSGAGELSYEGGVKAAQTWADYLVVELEHGLFNLPALDEFMRGLVDGGPTKSGHRTPAVITTLPTDGTDEHVMRANAWMIKQVLARGVHGILLCHAETPGAVKVFVESARYPFQTIGVGEGLDVGRRGAGGQGHAASIWGISTSEYLERADVWPLNPKGEIMLGLKIENKRALANAEGSASVPGIAFAEWGPGDMGMSHGYSDAHDPPYEDDMAKARERVKAACDAAKVAFLNGVNPDNVTQMIDEGVRVGSGGPEAAEIGRKYTKRTMPW
ncbi:MAG: aldolase/citrate lyase family protein [Candidatus Poribacteria bacterium]|nr:aldolase/citrate lyase family protein [Candidatus Poribacteria bacterium]